MLTKGGGRGKSDFARRMFQNGGQTNEAVQLHGKIETVNGLFRVIFYSGHAILPLSSTPFIVNVPHRVFRQKKDII